MQFLLGMSFAGLLGAKNTFGENLSRFSNAIASGEHAPVLVVSGDIVRVAGDELFEVSFRGGDIAFFHALHREAVAAESIERIFLNELLEHLPAVCACLGCAHNVAYYSGSDGKRQFRLRDFIEEEAGFEGRCAFEERCAGKRKRRSGARGKTRQWLAFTDGGSGAAQR
ncbi:MAG: hypothetical protein WA020_04665, partial [Candidatus Acidiferrales bacterium]